MNKESVRDKNKPRQRDISNERILEAAAELFREKGFNATSMRDIADAIGMKAGSLYYHFDSKEDLLDSVLGRGLTLAIDNLNANLAALPVDAPFSSRLKAAISAHLHSIGDLASYNAHNRSLLLQISQEQRERYIRRRREYDDMWKSLIETAMQAGELRNDLHAGVVRLYILGALSWTSEWLNPARNSYNALEEIAVDLFCRGIENKDFTCQP